MITPKLSAAFYAIRAIKPFISQECFKNCVPLLCSFSYKIQYYPMGKFHIQLEHLQVTEKNCQNTNGCRYQRISQRTFKTLNTLPLISQYIFSLILHVVSNNNYQFKINCEIHSISTRSKLNFYQPSSYLSVFQKGPNYVGIKLCNGLPPQIKELTHNIKQFESSLLGLYQHTFILQMNILIINIHNLVTNILFIHNFLIERIQIIII